MKMLATILFLFLPVVAFSQDMNQAAMQKMMQQAQKMQECMAKVDQSQLETLQHKAMQLETELQSLCNAGKRDAAMKRAVSFEKEMKKNPAFAAMQKCDEMMEDMPEGMVPEISVIEEDYNDSEHVCDEL